LIFCQPSSDLFGNLSIVHLSDYKWPSRREEFCASLKNFELSAFHDNFYQLGYGSTVRDEIIQRDCRHMNFGACDE
jgi:hypothetical protein